MTAAPAAPTRLSERWPDDVGLRDPLWFAWASGEDHPVPSAWGEEPPAEQHVAPAPPRWVREGERRALPGDVRRRLERLPYPGGRGSPGGVGGLLVAAFGLQWHDLENPYNAHRCYASPRCLYPGQVLVADEGRWWMLDVDGHALVAGPPATGGPRIALTGRFTRVPRSYRFARGTLTALEIGIMQRALGVAMELCGVPGRVRPPGAGAASLLAEAGLDPAREWSLPVVVELGGDLGAGAAARGPAPAPAPGADVEDHDPVLAEVVATDRAQALTTTSATAPAGRAIPAGIDAPPVAPPGPPSWAEVLWRRSSGRVVRGMRGLSARPERLGAPELAGMLAWAQVPPPGADLAAARKHLTLTVATRGVDGLPDGVHDVAHGAVTLRRADADVMARLEAEYGHGIGPDTGCDVRHCAAVWFLTLRPRPLVAEQGPGGWSAGLRAAGWIAHGLCLAAAATGRFARPVRELREEPTVALLGRGPDEMLPLAVVVGTSRHGTSGLLDLRP